MEDTKPICDLAVKAVRVQVVSEATTQSQLAALPAGVTMQSLEPYQAAPNRIHGLVRLHRYGDFVNYVQDFKVTGTRIFITPNLAFTSGGELALAVLDYPEPGKPAWSTHEVALVVSPSLEYKLLTSIANKGLMNQVDFVEALRDLARFCTSLSSADLLEIAQTLTLSSKGDFASIEDQFSGSVRFGYDVQVTANSEATKRMGIAIPETFSFNLPLLQGGTAQDVKAEFRYRVPKSKDEKVQLGIRLPDQKFIERAVLEQLVTQLSTDVGCPVALGDSNVPTRPGE